MRQPGAKTLARRSAEPTMDRAIGQSVLTPAFHYLVTEHGAHGSVNVADRQLKTDLRSLVDRRPAQPDQVGRIQRLVQPVILGFLAIHAHFLAGFFCRPQQRLKIDAAGLPV